MFLLKNICLGIIGFFCLPLIVMAKPTIYPINELHLPKGFKIAIYARVPGARSLTLGHQGVVYVGSRQQGKVYALVPNDKRTQAKQVEIIAKDMDWPNGVSYYRGHLYVAEVGRVWRFDHVDHLQQNNIQKQLLIDNLPTSRHHGWRYLRVSPQGKLVISIGAPCNVCESKDPRFNTIDQMNLDGSHFTVLATGVRNSVGFDWNPQDNSLWFTDNGRDWLGDNLPPDELNYLKQAGDFFGYPYFYGNGVIDPMYKKAVSSSKKLQLLRKKLRKPVVLLPAHVAPLGMRFYTGHQFPKRYWHRLFIAEHGSWNRSSKVGYQVVQVILSSHHAPIVKPFIYGWLKGQQAWGRPVDCLVMPDGALLVSDDAAGVVYRVSTD